MRDKGDGEVSSMANQYFGLHKSARKQNTADHKVEEEQNKI